MNGKVAIAGVGVLGLGLAFYIHNKNKSSTSTGSTNTGSTSTTGASQTSTNSTPGLGTSTMLSNPGSPQAQWLVSGSGSMITFNGLTAGVSVTGAYVQIIQSGLPTQYFVVVPGANGPSDVQSFLTGLGWQQVSVKAYKTAVAARAGSFDLSLVIPANAPTPPSNPPGYGAFGASGNSAGGYDMTDAEWQKQLAFLQSAGASQSTIQQEATFYGHPGQY